MLPNDAYAKVRLSGVPFRFEDHGTPDMMQRK
jgi:hypothetical protein